VFRIAAAFRRENPRQFDRDAVFERARQQLGGSELSLEQVETALYADLKSEQRVQKRPTSTPAQIVERYDRCQYQAVLLRATRVRARVRCSSPARYRDLFRALKFRRLHWASKSTSWRSPSF
jgi:predicted nuclease of restriction endonuclease-like RecB superfamily